MAGTVPDVRANEWLCYYLSIYKDHNPDERRYTVVWWNINPLSRPGNGPDLRRSYPMKTGMFTCGHQRLPIDTHSVMQASWVTMASKFGAAPARVRAGLKSGRHQTNQGAGQTYQMPIIGYTPETNGYPYT